MTEVKGSLGRIETLLRGMDDRLRKVAIDVAELKGRVSQLPTAWTLLTGASAWSWRPSALPSRWSGSARHADSIVRGAAARRYAGRTLRQGNRIWHPEAQ